MTVRDDVSPARESAAPIVVLSRLDGTWLDPYCHPPDEVKQAIQALVADRVPVVLFSSRTRAELERIQQQLDLWHPFVAENGGAAYFPHPYFGFDVPRARNVAGYQAIAFGKPYAEVVATLRRTAERLAIDIVGFSDMSVDEVAADCGLTVFQARLAKLREHDEPFRTAEPGDAARRQLIKGLHSARLECTRGERHAHAGAMVDQGAIVDLVLSLYQRMLGEFVSVGIGDPEHDLPLLRRVDVPFVLARTADSAGGARIAEAPREAGGTLADRAGAIRDVVALVRRTGVDAVRRSAPAGQADMR